MSRLLTMLILGIVFAGCYFAFLTVDKSEGKEANNRAEAAQAEVTKLLAKIKEAQTVAQRAADEKETAVKKALIALNPEAAAKIEACFVMVYHQPPVVAAPVAVPAEAKESK